MSPLPNEHACRLRDPEAFQDGSFRRSSRKHNGKTYYVIQGRLKGEDTMTDQSFRYPKSTWSASQARAHCEDHDGSFEAASDSGLAPQARKMEYRAFALEGLQLERREGERPRIVGHAAVFNVPSEALVEWEGGRLIEKIAPGAFAKTIREGDIRAMVNHNPDRILGRNKAKTLRLAEDDRGLAVEIDPPDTQYARDLIISMERGDLSQMSFGFWPIKVRWEREKDEATGVVTLTRTLLEVRLFEVSVVAIPAFPDTDAHVRGLLLGPDVPEELRAAIEPIQADHSVDDDSSDDEPGQAAHSGEERERLLDLIRHTL